MVINFSKVQQLILIKAMDSKRGKAPRCHKCKDDPEETYSCAPFVIFSASHHQALDYWR